MRPIACSFLLFSAGYALAAEHDYVRTVHPLPELTPARLEAVLRRIDRYTEDHLASEHTPGLWMTVVKDGKVVWLKGYGCQNLEKKTPMTPDTMTMIASCSKAFTSTLALMGVQDGKVDLNAPVRRYLPYFHLKSAEADAGMTVADLMCHSSGLPRTDGAWITGALNQQDCLDVIANCEPTFNFRENAQYSNILVATAATVAGAAYQESVPDLLKQKIFDPLQMSSTSIDPVATCDRNRMAIGYWFNPLSESIERERYVEAQQIAGAGAIKSTARDMSHWLQFHLSGGAFNGRQLIASGTLEQAYKPRMAAAYELDFGMGWLADSRRPEQAIWHDGALPGFSTEVVLIPSKHLGFAISANNQESELAYSLSEHVMDELIGKPDAKWRGQPRKESGVYVDPTAHHLLRIDFNGSLWATVDQGKPIRLNRSGWRSYSTADARNPQWKLTFLDDKTEPGHAMATLTAADSTTVYHHSVKLDAGITVDALMRKSIAAYGGAEALGKPFNVTGRMTTVQRQEGLNGMGLIERSNGDLGLLEREYFGRTYLSTTHSGVNSESASSTQTDFKIFPTLGSDLTDVQIDSETCQAFGWRSQFSKVEIVARQELNGEPVYVLRKTPLKPGSEIIEYLSERTGLAVRREFGSPANVTLFSDYRRVGDVMLPYQFSTIDSSFHREDYTVSAYTESARYPHWAFNPLGSAKPPKE